MRNCSYLREEAKEKWAGVLGEKFRGLSRGLLPVDRAGKEHTEGITHCCRRLLIDHDHIKSINLSQGPILFSPGCAILTKAVQLVGNCPTKCHRKWEEIQRSMLKMKREDGGQVTMQHR